MKWQNGEANIYSLSNAPIDNIITIGNTKNDNNNNNNNNKKKTENRLSVLLKGSFTVVRNWFRLSAEIERKAIITKKTKCFFETFPPQHFGNRAYECLVLSTDEVTVGHRKDIRVHAEVWSVSLSSERFNELWIACG